VKPIADHYVGVRLEFYQLQGRKIRGDTADCFVFTPAGEKVAGNRCWKNRTGLTAKELTELAEKHSGPGERAALKLSWFLMDPEWYRKDVTDDGAVLRYRSANRPLGEARKARRPLLRVDGPAIEALESNQEFLTRHVRQFWWTKGDPKAPSRLVVLNSNEFPPDAKADELTGPMRRRVPAVMSVIDLSSGVDLEKVTPVLDECWRKYMADRPPNNISIHRANVNYSKEYEERYEKIEETIRQLARDGKLRAPGGRPLAPAK
jgi:hypothetical protein